MKPRSKTWLPRAVWWAGVPLVFLLVLEGVARLIWEGKYHDRLETALRDHQHIDYRRNLIVPTPGARVTLGASLARLRELERPLGAARLEEFQRKHSLPDTTALIRINRHGFRGPDVAVPKPGGIFRILTVGDSCTWGLSVSEECPYPRVLERTLNQLVGDQSELRVEVVNGGFSGDGLEQSLARVEQFVSVEPDLITIYLGWNTTIHRADPRKLRSLYRLSALYRLYYHTAVWRLTRWQKPSGEPELRYDPHDPSLDAFREHSLERDVRDLDRLVGALRRRRPSAAIVLITLAGVLDCEVQPDSLALQMSYPPDPLEQSGNLYLWALMARRWNDAIRGYASGHGLDVIDLEEYARARLARRSDYFSDHCHWNAEGYREVGRFLAGELAGYVPVDRKGRASLLSGRFLPAAACGV